MDEEAVRAVRVEGRVQGVGFRAWTARAGKELGLRGWVRNLPDGAVEVHLAGVPEAVEELEARLRKGPGTARVDRLVPLDEVGGLPADGFEVRW